MKLSKKVNYNEKYHLEWSQGILFLLDLSLFDKVCPEQSRRAQTDKFLTYWTTPIAMPIIVKGQYDEYSVLLYCHVSTGCVFF